MNTYLTDEELLRLIADVEENEPAAPPPDLKDAVLKRIGQDEPAAPPPDLKDAVLERGGYHDQEVHPPMRKNNEHEQTARKSQIIEYRHFRNRVAASVAAALILFVVLPEWNNIVSTQNKQTTVEEAAADPVEESFIDGLRKSNYIRNWRNSHYISDWMNGREE